MPRSINKHFIQTIQNIFALITLHSFRAARRFPSVCCLELIKAAPSQRPEACSLNTRTHMIECVCVRVWDYV